MSKIGYKATSNYACRDKVYEIGKQYKMRKKPICCVQGYHYCKLAYDVLQHYSYDSKFKLLEIEDRSSRTHEQHDKSATDNIKIIREITDPNELYNLLGVYKTFHKNENVSYLKERQYNKDYCEKHFDSKGTMRTKYIFYETTSTWIKYTYNSSGLETKLEKSDGYVQTKAYDKKGRLVEEKASDGNFIFIEYDVDGEISNRKASDGQQIKTTISKNGDKIKITKINGVVTDKIVKNSKNFITYSKTTSPSGYIHTKINTYHPNGNIKRTTSKTVSPRGTQTNCKDETYSKNGNLLMEKDSDGNVTEHFYKNNRLNKSITTTYYE